MKKTQIEKTEKKEKLPKQEKQIKAKKLPGILKKNYTRKKLDKLLKHIYVPTNKEMVQNLFVPNPKKEGKFYIPKDTLIVKSQFVKLKKIGKDVASQKFSIKVVPFVAVVATFVVAIVLICAFKNFVARKVLTNVMQGAFGAKTDIEYINVEILGSSINIKKLEQGYKEDPMKNLFELEQVIIDFNLTQLLRGKFDLQNIAVEGINVMTPRKTSAALPVKPKSNEKSAFQIQLEQKVQVAQDAAKEELQKLFEQYNPDAILNSLEKQLESPLIVNDIYTLGDNLVKKWKDKPAEVSSQVTDFSNKATKLANTDFSKINDPIQIKNFIQEITTIVQDGKKIAENTKSIVNDVKTDSKKVQDASKKLTSAIEKDKKFVESELNKIKSFTLKDGVRLLSGPIDTILYKVVGKYYPYLKKGVALALDAKAKSSSSPKKEKEVKPDNSRKRLAGRNVYYRKNTIPKFIIERMSVSGVNWSGLATDISSDMDVRGKPAVANVKMSIQKQNHQGDVTVDLRSNTEAPLVKVNYFGDNYPINFSSDQFNVNSSSEIVGRINVLQTGNVLIGADLKLKNLLFETQKFEPEFAYNLYSRALSKLKEVKVGVDLEFTSDEKFDMKISSDADKKVAQILKELVNEELDSLKKNAKVQITKLLNENTNGAATKLKEFIDIENGINAESIKVDKLNKLLDSKKAELQKRLESEAKKAASDALGNMFGNIQQKGKKQ